MAIVANGNKGYTQDEFKEYLKTTIDAISADTGKNVKAATLAEQNATSQANSATSAAKNATSQAQNASNYAASASNSAKASATSESNAKTSETNAKTSETNAKSSETASADNADKAHTSEVNAKTSETNATNSASSAKTSETNAKTSASNASTSATTAQNWAVSETSPDGAIDTDSYTGKTQSSRSWALASKGSAESASASASTATTQASSATASAKSAGDAATSASSSATSASSSATTAKNSATAAATSATNASNSETQASEYKTSASASASTAASSATSASTSATSASTSATNAKAAMNTANTAASSASTSATNASTSASNAAKAEVAAKTAQAEAEKARDDANSAVTKLTGVMKYAGQVDNYSDLANVTKSKGDVWNIVNADATNGVKAGDNVAWNGTNWDNLSGVVDLSVYAEKADYQKTITSATANGATITFNHKDGTTSTATVNNVASATAATNDAKGQKIDTTYEKITDASNVHTSLQNSINSLSTGKQDKLTFDTTPTTNSTNPVTSGGIKTALDSKLDTTGGTITGEVDIVGALAVTSNKDAVSVGLFPDAKNLIVFSRGKIVFTSEASGGYDDLAYIDPSTKTYHGNLSGNADTATKATQDASGNVIADTYAKKTDVTVKGVKVDGSTSPLVPDSSGVVTIPNVDSAISGAVGKITTYTGATSTANGTGGLVPAPTKGQQEKFLKADGTWGDVPKPFNAEGHLVLPNGAELWVY